MGREIKRVPLDFDHPLDVTWPGFVNPYPSRECSECEGSGYSPEAQKLQDEWYYGGDSGEGWQHNLTQDEVDALVAENRLHNFTHQWLETQPGEWKWVPNDPLIQPTAEQVNEWSRKDRMGHDCLNQNVCIEARCKRLGYILMCSVCGGNGKVWSSPELKRLHEDWKEYEPPTGEGWQVWETVGEGSPITPVFATPEELARYLSEVGDEWTRKSIAKGNGHRTLPSYEDALAFVTQGWAASSIWIGNGPMLGPYESSGVCERLAKQR